MSLIYGYSKAVCKNGGGSESQGVIFKEVVGSFVLPTDGGMVEITSSSGWNNIPDDGVLVFMLFKVNSANSDKVRVSVSSILSGSWHTRQITDEIRLSDKWGGASTLEYGGRKHSYKELHVDITGNTTGTVEERTVDVKFVYIV